MGAKKSDGEDAGSILQRCDQPKVVSFDVEHDPPTFEYAGLGIGRFHFLGIAPLRAPRDLQPCFVLRARGLDALVAGALRDSGIPDDSLSPDTALGA